MGIRLLVANSDFTIIYLGPQETFMGAIKLAGTYLVPRLRPEFKYNRSTSFPVYDIIVLHNGDTNQQDWWRAIEDTTTFWD
jgi:hypothetical protein